MIRSPKRKEPLLTYKHSSCVPASEQEGEREREISTCMNTSMGCVCVCVCVCVCCCTCPCTADSLRVYLVWGDSRKEGRLTSCWLQAPRHMAVTQPQPTALTHTHTHTHIHTQKVHSPGRGKRLTRKQIQELLYLSNAILTPCIKHSSLDFIPASDVCFLSALAKQIVRLLLWQWMRVTIIPRFDFMMHPKRVFTFLGSLFDTEQEF